MLNQLLSCFFELYTLENNEYVKAYTHKNGEYIIKYANCIYKNKVKVNDPFNIKRKAWANEHEFRIWVEMKKPFNGKDLFIKLDEKLFNKFYLILGCKVTKEKEKQLNLLKNKHKRSDLKINFNLIKKYEHQLPNYLSDFIDKSKTNELNEYEIKIFKVIKDVTKA